MKQEIVQVSNKPQKESYKAQGNGVSYDEYQSNSKNSHWSANQTIFAATHLKQRLYRACAKNRTNNTVVNSVLYV